MLSIEENPDTSIRQIASEQGTSMEQFNVHI
jgi:hypothetical protein